MELIFEEVKLPSKSVTAPTVVAPFTNTLAPIIGSPDVSFTLPFSVMVWAKAVTDTKSSKATESMPLSACVRFELCDIITFFGFSYLLIDNKSFTPQRYIPLIIVAISSKRIK